MVTLYAFRLLPPPPPSKLSHSALLSPGKKTKPTLYSWTNSLGIPKLKRRTEIKIHSSFLQLLMLAQLGIPNSKYLHKSKVHNSRNLRGVLDCQISRRFINMNDKAFQESFVIDHLNSGIISTYFNCACRTPTFRKINTSFIAESHLANELCYTIANCK